jgi:hypothetical protein
MLIDVECPQIRQAYPIQAGQTVKWLSSDNKEHYEKNVKKSKHLLEKHKWLGKEIDYRINKYGFRCEEFTDDPSILWLGCSYTSGIGVQEENTFAHIVSRKLNLKNFNLSQAAGSNDTCFRIGSFWIPILKPKIVVLVKPDEVRFELINTYGDPEASPERELSRYWVMQKLNRDIQLDRNISGLKYYCQTVNAKFYEVCGRDVFVHRDRNGTPLHITDYARDLGHPGIILHQIAATRLYNQITEDDK